MKNLLKPTKQVTIKKFIRPRCLIVLKIGPLENNEQIFAIKKSELTAGKTEVADSDSRSDVSAKVSKMIDKNNIAEAFATSLLPSNLRTSSFNFNRKNSGSSSNRSTSRPSRVEALNHEPLLNNNNNLSFLVFSRNVELKKKFLLLKNPALDPSTEEFPKGVDPGLPAEDSKESDWWKLPNTSNFLLLFYAFIVSSLSVANYKDLASFFGRIVKAEYTNSISNMVADLITFIRITVAILTITISFWLLSQKLTEDDNSILKERLTSMVAQEQVHYFQNDQLFQTIMGSGLATTFSNKARLWIKADDITPTRLLIGRGFFYYFLDRETDRPCLFLRILNITEYAKKYLLTTFERQLTLDQKVKNRVEFGVIEKEGKAFQCMPYSVPTSKNLYHIGFWRLKIQYLENLIGFAVYGLSKNAVKIKKFPQKKLFIID